MGSIPPFLRGLLRAGTWAQAGRLGEESRTWKCDEQIGLTIFCRQTLANKMTTCWCRLNYGPEIYQNLLKIPVTAGLRSLCACRIAMADLPSHVVSAIWFSAQSIWNTSVLCCLVIQYICPSSIRPRFDRKPCKSVHIHICWLWLPNRFNCSVSATSKKCALLHSMIIGQQISHAHSDNMHYVKTSTDYFAVWTTETENVKVTRSNRALVHTMQWFWQHSSPVTCFSMALKLETPLANKCLHGTRLRLTSRRTQQ